MNRSKLLSSRKAFVFSLLFTLLFTALSSAILHDWGRIRITETEVYTQGGNRLSVRIFRPGSATAQTPAPAVVFTHGLTVNKSSYAQYGLELARRGFVVLMPDMLNHGNSEITGPEVYLAPAQVSDAYGSYAVVRYAAALDYVDRSQIGVAGHSAGGHASNNCVILDDQAAEPLISAIYLVSSDPVFKDEEGNWANVYGDRDLGLYYTLYDHVYFRGEGPDGQPRPVKEWLGTDSAKSLFAFGQDPSAFEGDAVIPGRTYWNQTGGTPSFRRVNAAAEIHPRPQSGTLALAAVCDFFQDTFQAPDYIVGASQRYAGLVVSNLLGMLGVFVSCVLGVGCLMRTRFFSVLKNEEAIVLRPAPDRKGRIVFWCLTVLNCLFAFVSITCIFRLGFGYCCSTIFAQQTTNIYALWALINGSFMLLTSFVSYVLRGRSGGASMSSWGLKISVPGLMKSILAALAGCGIVFAIVAVANRIFLVDYRYYFWGLSNISPENLGVFFVYLPAFLVFGMAVSIAVNSAYHNRIAHEPEWANDLFFAAMNLIPSLVITLVGYGLYKKTGVKPFVFGSTYTYTYTINAIPVFPVAVILIRRLFKRCGNPYIPGIMIGILLCWMQVSYSFTMHADMYYGPMAAYLP